MGCVLYPVRPRWNKAVGWVEPRGHAPLVEVVDGQWILRLMVEVKVVPSSVVKRKLQEQVDRSRPQPGASPAKAPDLADDIRLGLLPLAFSKQYAVQVWVDPKSGLLIDRRRGVPPRQTRWRPAWCRPSTGWWFDYCAQTSPPGCYGALVIQPQRRWGSTWA